MKLRWLLLVILIPLFSGVLKAQVNYCTAKSPSASYNLTNVNGLTIHDIVIKNNGFTAIHLTKCKNIKIVRVQILGANNAYAIRLDNCSDVTIDTVSIQDQVFGVYAANCTGNIQVKNSQFFHIQGIMLGDTKAGHSIQYSHCNGAGQVIDNNRIDNPPGAGGSNPRPFIGDLISLFACNGTTSSYIHVYGNWGRYGGSDLVTLADGLTLADGGGTYQDAQNNVFVESGYAGLTVGGGTNIIVKGNTIYSPSRPYSAAGLTSANFSAGVSNSTISNNVVNWFAGLPSINAQRDTVLKLKNGSGVVNNTVPIGWKTNTVKAPINGSVLPPVIFQVCSSLSFPPLAAQTYGVADYFIPATSSNPISFTSGNTAVATIVSGNKIHVVGAGSSVIVATDGISSLPETLVINKAGLTIAAQSFQRAVGVSNPAFVALYSGFQYGENNSVLTSQPVLSCPATTGSPSGVYVISVCCAAGANYNITYVPGNLLVGFVGGFTVAVPGTVIFQH